MVLLPPVPGPLGPPSALPSVVPARLARPEAWRIERVAAPKRGDARSLAVVVQGRRVVLGPRDGYDYVDGVERGRDGSLLVSRANRRVSPPEWRTSIWYRGRETPAGVVAYLDRRNHATYFVREEMPWIGDTPAPPATAEEAYGVRDGRPVSFGWGYPEAWTPRGALVLRVPVDGQGQPSGPVLREGTTTRIVDRGGEWRVADYGYLGCATDGTVLLSWLGAADARDPRAAPPNRVLLWRGGRFVAHVALPARWCAVGIAPAGWILLRRTAEPRPGDGEDSLAREERDWTAGVLRGTTLTPLRFPRPRGTERFRWRSGTTAYGRRAFRFAAFGCPEERTFRVSAG